MSISSRILPILRHQGWFREILSTWLFAILLIPVHAAAPSWWVGRGVIQPGRPADDFAVINQGQLKNLVRAAVEEMNVGLAGGAGSVLNNMVSGWGTSLSAADDFAVVNMGQLKAAARPVYERLYSASVISVLPVWAIASSPGDEDFAIANIGQAKSLFSFDLQLDALSANQPYSPVLPESLSPGSGSNFNLVDGYVGYTGDLIPRVHTAKMDLNEPDEKFDIEDVHWTPESALYPPPKVTNTSGPIDECKPQYSGDVETVDDGTICACQHGVAQRFIKQSDGSSEVPYYNGTPVNLLTPEELAEALLDDFGWTTVHESLGNHRWEGNDYCDDDGAVKPHGFAGMRIAINSILPEGADPITETAWVVITRKSGEQSATQEEMSIRPGERESEPVYGFAPPEGKVEVTFVSPSRPAPPPVPLSLNDAAGTRYRKVGLNGAPMTDAKPQVQDENGENAEETHIDPFTSQLRHSVSDVYVEAPGSLLPLAVRRDLASDSWNDRSGLRAHERPFQPFGPGWSSNICAYVRFDGYRKAEITDEQGSRQSYYLIGGDNIGIGGAWFHDRQEHRDVKARMNIFQATPVPSTTEYPFTSALPQFSTIKLTKKFGTVCTYEMVSPAALHQAIGNDRLESSQGWTSNTYARLTSVVDRHGNELRYEYPFSSSLIPSRIYDPARPGHQVRISQDNGRVTTVQDPNGNLTQYVYTQVSAVGSPHLQHSGFTGSPVSTASLLTTVQKGESQVGYHYLVRADREISDSKETLHTHVELSKIVDERGFAYQFSYEMNRGIYSWTGTGLKQAFGLPMLLTGVTLPGSLGQVTLLTTRQIMPAGGHFDTAASNFHTLVSWNGPDGTRQYDYQFSDAEALTPTGAPQATESQTSVTYAFKTMKIVAPPVVTGEAESLRTETFRFSPAYSMALTEVTDRNGGLTKFIYDASGYDDPIEERNYTTTTAFDKKTFSYDVNTRILTAMTDARGITTTYALGSRAAIPGATKAAIGLRISETVLGPTGVPGGSLKAWTYAHPVFAGFATMETHTTASVPNGSTVPSLLISPVITTTYATGDIAKTGWWRMLTETRMIDGNPSKMLTVSDFAGNKRSVTDGRGLTTLFDYDNQNRLVKVTHPDDTIKDLVYDAHGNLVQETDEAGVLTFHTYDALNRRTSTTLDLNRNGVADARYTTTTFDTQGNPVYDGDLVVSQVLEYNSLNQPLLQEDARSIQIQQEYDVLGRPTRAIVNAGAPTEAEKQITACEYRVSNINGGKEVGGSVFDVSSFKPVRITDPRGNVTSFTYDALYRRTKEQRADNNTVHTTYNKNGQVSSVSSAAASSWTPVLETVEGVTVMKQSGTTVFITQMVYDALGQVTKTTLPDLKTVQTFYTPHGKPWRQVDETGAVTLTYYNEAGLAIRVQQDNFATSGPAIYPTTFMGYDLAGNLNKVTDPEGRITQTRYDRRNRAYKVIYPPVVDARSSSTTPLSPITTTAYDAVGRVIRSTDPLGNSTSNFYDAAGRLSRSLDALDKATHFSYDGGGNILTTTNALGQTVTNIYDNFGRLKNTTDKEVITVSFEYDKNGNRTKVKDGLNQATTFQYDNLNRLTSQIFANGNTFTYAYTLDRKTSETNANLKQTTFTYDLNGRLTEKLAPSGTASGTIISTSSYDVATGRLIKVIDRADGQSATAVGVTTEYGYDKLGRVTSEKSYGRQHLYEYDKAGNRTRSLLAAYSAVPRIVTTAYDALNRPSKLTDDNQTPTVLTDDRVTSYGYDLAGRAMKQVSANGQVTLNDYDANGRLTTRKLYLSNANLTNTGLLAAFTWIHDDIGNVTNQNEVWYASGGQPARTRVTAMTYDGTNRLKTETVSDTGFASVITAYRYDKANNRIGKDVVLGTGTAPTGVEVGFWTYTYNNANQLTRLEKRATATGSPLMGVTYTYDVNGNRDSRIEDGTATAIRRTTEYVWDTWNRLDTVEVPVSLTSTGRKVYKYNYDYRMRRRSTAQSGGGLTTRHTAVVFSGGLSVVEYERGSNAALSNTVVPAVQYWRGPDMGGGVGGLLGTVRNPLNTSNLPIVPTTAKPLTLRYNLSNGRGDVVAQSDASAALTWTASYEAYGKRTKETGTNEDKQRANSKDEDPTGLLNEGFRYRDIETGVWLSRDPAGFVDGPNLYAFVKQNPWTAFDPLGLAGEKPGFIRRLFNALFRRKEAPNKTPQKQNTSDLEKRTIKNVAYKPDGLAIDLDGHPQCYHPDGKPPGLDNLANGHYGADLNRPVCGWVTDKNGKGITQGPNDPAPGYYVSKTSLEDGTKGESDTTRYVNSGTINYMVTGSARRLGEIATVAWTRIENKEKVTTIQHAIVGDSGNSSGAEGSLALARNLGHTNASGNNGIERGQVRVVIFEGSGDKTPLSQTEINRRGEFFFERYGGINQLNRDTEPQ